MSIYAADGQIIRQLVRWHLIAGSHRLRWDATDNAGRSVASGTYLLYLRTPDGLRRSKLTLLR
jgi:flagellar hook assembly protein FlgD